MSFVTVSAKLKQILDGISSASLPVKYERMAGMPTTFPAGMIILDSQGASLETPIDTSHNEISYRFILRAVFPIEDTDAAVQKWLGLLDTLGDTFRTSGNQTLGGTVHYFMIDGYRQFFTTDYGQPTVVLDVNVTARALKSI